MPAHERSLALTDAYRARLQHVRQTTGLTLTAAWRALDVRDLEGTFHGWLTAAAGTVEAAQRTGVLLTDAYLARYVASELGHRQARPQGVDADAYAGRDRYDRPLTRALLPAIYTIKQAIALQRPAPAALQLGLNRGLRVAGAEAMAAPRAALSDLMVGSDDIVGWRRVASAGACGACLGASTGAIRATDAVPDAHDGCRCTAEAVIRDARDTVQRPTGAEQFAAMTRDEQDQLFAGRGGAAKADLIRAGDVQLEQLLTRQPQALGGEQITETPLSQLQPQ